MLWRPNQRLLSFVLTIDLSLTRLSSSAWTNHPHHRPCPASLRPWSQWPSPSVVAPSRLRGGGSSSSSSSRSMATTSETTATPSSSMSTLFPEDCVEYDHYSGVTVHLDRLLDDHVEHTNTNRQDATTTTTSLFSSPDFSSRLREQLDDWRRQGKRGVWMHVPKSAAACVAACVQLGFDFHMVVHGSPGSGNDDSHGSERRTEIQQQQPKAGAASDGILVLSQWLPNDADSVNRLPLGPTHQVGVGCLVWHPDDIDNDHSTPKKTLPPPDRRRLLVVQEKTGPAAAWNLWKMPTGLSDVSEDVHRAAERELWEETGVRATFDGLVAVRQAHATTTATTTTANQPLSDKDSSNKAKSKVSRKASDLFFVCQLTLDKNDSAEFTACPDEIAAIQWMPVGDYCAQERWQTSPVYLDLNRLLYTASSRWSARTKPVFVDGPHTNTVYGQDVVDEPTAADTPTAGL